MIGYSNAVIYLVFGMKGTDIWIFFGKEIDMCMNNFKR
jgi:hypothetical protein